MIFSLPSFAPENLVSRDRFGSPVCSSPCSGWSWCLLMTRFLPSSTAASIYLFKPPYAIGSDPSLSGHAIAYRWCSLPKARRHRACKPQGSSSNGCYLGKSPWTHFFLWVMTIHIFISTLIEINTLWSRLPRTGSEPRSGRCDSQGPRRCRLQRRRQLCCLLRGSWKGGHGQCGTPTDEQPGALIG